MGEELWDGIWTNLKGFVCATYSGRLLLVDTIFKC